MFYSYALKRLLLERKCNESQRRILKRICILVTIRLSQFKSADSSRYILRPSNPSFKHIENVKGQKN